MSEMLKFVEESNKVHAANCSAILSLLMQKGIITATEFEEARLRALAAVDQEFAKKKEEEMKKYREENPGQAFIMDLINKSLNGDDEGI